MTTEPSQNETPTVNSEPVNPQTSLTTDDQSKVLKQETAALIEAIQKRAQAEIQAARELTRETYLNAVRQTREAIENDKLIDRDRIEETMHQLQQEAEKNWGTVRTEIESFGTRLTQAAQTAWETLTHPKSPGNGSGDGSENDAGHKSDEHSDH